MNVRSFFPKENRLSAAAAQLSQRLAAVKPAHWLLLFGIAGGLCAALIPGYIWRTLLRAAQSNKALVTLLLLFALLSLSLVWTSGQRVDAAFFSFFNRPGQRPRWVDTAMLLYTQLGNGLTAFAAAPILFFFENRLLAYQLVFGTLSLWFVVELIKTCITRSRPFDKLRGVRIVGTRARGYSFPSGHTSQAFFMATMLGRCFESGTALCAVLYFAALLVGITRIYVGMHYPRDVLAGACLGTVWGFIGAVLYMHIFA